MSTNLGKIIADFSSQLALQINVGDTTGTLQSAADKDGNALPAGQYYITVDGQDQTKKEHFQIQLNGTAITGIKSISRQGVLSTGSVRIHRAGAPVIMSDFADLFYLYRLLSGFDLLDSTSPLGYDGAPSITLNNQLATKAYVDGVAIAGAPNANATTKGIVQEATTAQVNAGTDAGSTGAKLFASPADLAASIYGLQLPTANQKSALVGNSGTAVGAGNKYVDNSDTSTTAAASKVVRALASGLIDSSFLPATDQQTYVAGEAITVGNPVSLNPADGKIYQASSLTAGNYRSFAFIGFAQNSAAPAANVTVQMAGIVTGLALGNQQTTVASQIDISNTTNTAGSALQVYTGNDAWCYFFTGKKTANITQINVNISLTGGGSGQLTCGVYSISNIGTLTPTLGVLLGSQNIGAPAAGESVFTFGSPITVTPNTWYGIRLTAAAGNNTNCWNWLQSTTDAAIPVAFGAGNGGQRQNATGSPWFKVFTTLQQNWQPGDIIWLSDTNGAINVDVPGTVMQPIGLAISASQIKLTKSAGDIYLGSMTIPAPGTAELNYGFPVPKNCTKMVMSANGGISSRPSGMTQAIFRDGPTLFYMSEQDGASDWTVNFFWGKWNFPAVTGTPANMIAYFYQ